MSDAQALFEDLDRFSFTGASWPRELARRLLPKPILCEICGDTPATDFDHDHFLGCARHSHQCPVCMRGWLCNTCNLILGAFERHGSNIVDLPFGVRRFVPAGKLDAYLLWAEERREAILSESGFCESLPELMDWSLETLFGPNPTGRRVDDFWEDAEESLLGRSWADDEDAGEPV